MIRPRDLTEPNQRSGGSRLGGLDLASMTTRSTRLPMNTRALSTLESSRQRFRLSAPRAAATKLREILSDQSGHLPLQFLNYSDMRDRHN